MHFWNFSTHFSGENRDHTRETAYPYKTDEVLQIKRPTSIRWNLEDKPCGSR